MLGHVLDNDHELLGYGPLVLDKCKNASGKLQCKLISQALQSVTKIEALLLGWCFPQKLKRLQSQSYIALYDRNLRF